MFVRERQRHIQRKSESDWMGKKTQKGGGRKPREWVRGERRARGRRETDGGETDERNR